ncbi:hypothetical protein VTL71DRAFT_9925 [Oculimacula yallundae]|uniref:Uncharacterized protein n=1 Tax=Oculimacula yallundae TaxID=86028 RepID=A0ABR4BQW9_9HELO
MSNKSGRWVCPVIVSIIDLQACNGPLWAPYAQHYWPTEPSRPLLEDYGITALLCCASQIIGLALLSYRSLFSVFVYSASPGIQASCQVTVCDRSTLRFELTAWMFVGYLFEREMFRIGRKEEMKRVYDKSFRLYDRYGGVNKNYRHKVPILWTLFLKRINNGIDQHAAALA